MISLHARQRRLLTDLLGRARRDVLTLVDVLALDPGSAALELARNSAMVSVTDYELAIMHHDEAHPDPELTPVRPPSTAAMRAVRNDVKAAFAAAGEHSEAATNALKGTR